MTKNAVIYVDMDDVMCDYTTAFNERLKEYPQVAYPQSQYGFFSSLKPIIGAVESVKTLIDRGYNVYVLTCPSFKNPLCYTEKRLWIETYFGLAFTERLIISTNKGLLKYKTWVDVMQRFD